MNATYFHALIVMLHKQLWLYNILTLNRAGTGDLFDVGNRNFNPRTGSQFILMSSSE
jgi:hypothetical protein